MMNLFLLLILLMTGPTLAPPAARDAPPARCSVITVAKGGRVLFGGNDDYIHPDSWYWVDPGDDEHYGAIWIGRPDNVQQGVNERGLAYDANGLPRVDVEPHAERAAVSGGYTGYPIHILHDCATVEEVVAWVETHAWHSYMHDQMHFADATGDAVVISAGAHGEVAFTRKPTEDGFLISTNFNLANPANGFSYPCWRYARAKDMLGSLLEREEPLTVEDVAGVLDAVHEERVNGWTVESLVADLTLGRVYLYYFHQFDRPIVLEVDGEIANPRDPGPLSRLFPREVREEAARRYENLRALSRRCDRLGAGWLLAVVASTITLVAFVRRRGRSFRFWIPAAIVLGPIALLALWIAGSLEKPDRGRAAVLEAIGGVMPTVLAWVAFLVAIVRIPALQGTWPAQLAFVLAVPPILGWLVFAGSLLAPAVREKPGAFLARRLPQAIVAANLGMAGISAVAMPLVKLSLRSCPAEPLSPWTLSTWWAMVALSALPGAAVLFLYERWAVSRASLAWSVLAQGHGEPTTPPFRSLWWWIPLSYIVFVGGTVAGVLAQQLTGA